MDFTRRRFPLTVKSLCSNIRDEFLPSGPSDSRGDPRSPAESSVTAEEQGQRDATVHQGNGGVFMATYHMWKFPGLNPGYPIMYEVQPRHMVADTMQINKDYFKPRVFEYSDNDKKTDTTGRICATGSTGTSTTRNQCVCWQARLLQTCGGFHRHCGGG